MNELRHDGPPVETHGLCLFIARGRATTSFDKHISMPTQLLDDWTPKQIASLNNTILVAKHRLNELELFSDENLARTIDAHPQRDLSVNTMGTDPMRRSDWREGNAGDLDGETLLDAVKHGRLWLNLRRVMDHHSEYDRIVNELYGEMEATCLGIKTFNRSANLLISSPSAIVYYHLDCPVNMLWHLRGTKRVWAYPLERGVVSDETIEAVLCGEAPEELEFRANYDNLAVVRELNPGEMITWPQHTPHRVVNTGGLNVSLSTEHMTRAAGRKNNVYLANRHFRKLLGGTWRSTATSGWRPALKEAALRIVRRLPMIAPASPKGYKYPVSFMVDPETPLGVRLLDGSVPGEQSQQVMSLPMASAAEFAIR